MAAKKEEKKNHIDWSVLSLNLALKPLDVLDRQTKGALGINPADCDPEYQVYNSHERRARGFIQSLEILQHQPDILCLQELMWSPMIVLIDDALQALGYATHSIIHPLAKANKGTPTLAASGLAIYVKTSRLKIEHSGIQTFNTRIGLDHLSRKGLIWAYLRPQDNNKPFIVMTLHPQAYVQVSSTSPPCGESEMASGLRDLLRMEKLFYGGYPKVIETVHKDQIDDIASILALLKQKFSKHIQNRILLVGDWNINSYAPRTGYDLDEQDYYTAQKGDSQNAEYRSLLIHTLHLKAGKRLNAQEYPFSWDPRKIVFARDQGGDSPVYQNIDHAFLLRADTNASLTERLLPLYLKPFPELGAFWSFSSHKCRMRLTSMQEEKGEEGYKAIIIASQRRISFGQLQRKKALKKWTEEGEGKRQTWEEFVLALPYRESSQLWKGFAFYEIQDTDVGAIWMQKHEPLEIGQIHPYRMLNAVSDHMALWCSYIPS